MTAPRSDSEGEKVDPRIEALQLEVRSLRVELHQLLFRQVIPLANDVFAIRHRLGWLFVPKEDYAFVLHLANGYAAHEAGTRTVMEKLLRPGDVALDLGAHIGLHTFPMCRAVGPTGRVIAVEPLPRTAECLRQALLCNDLLDRCEVVEAVVSDAEGTTDFFLGSNSMLGSLIPAVDDHKAIKIREMRSDSLVPAGGRVDFIKMDVEGAELKALAGLERIIADNQELLLIAEFGPSHLERVGIEIADWFGAFRQAGFDRAFVIDEESGTLRKVDIAAMANVFSVNILFSRGNRQLDSLLQP